MGVRQVAAYRLAVAEFRRHLSADVPEGTHDTVIDTPVTVCARKRPLIRAEIEKGSVDGVTIVGSEVYVHRQSPRLGEIDVEHARFQVDRAFDDTSQERAVYEAVAKPLVQFTVGRLASPRVGLLLLYGQTSSGKTHTATHLHQALARDLCAREMPAFQLAFFEVRGGRVWDLLAQGCKGRRCVVRETHDEVHIGGLVEHDVQDAAHMLQLISAGSRRRTTSQTVQNETSSRSHALLRLTWRHDREVPGQLSRLWIVDLAGVEKAADSLADSRPRRLEGADINQSMLALKECLRAMRSQPRGRVPFRASRLTLLLKDAFYQRSNDCAPTTQRVVMLCCLAPCAHQTEATTDTLRYATLMREAPGRGAASALTNISTPGSKSLQHSEDPGNSGVVVSAGHIGTRSVDERVESPTESEDDDYDNNGAHDFSRVSASVQEMRRRRKTAEHVDIVLAAAEPASAVTMVATPSTPTTAAATAKPSGVVLDEAVRSTHAQHSRVVAELLDAEDAFVCSLQGAAPSNEARSATLRKLADQAVDSTDLADVCWSVVDAMAEQAAQATALQSQALALLKTFQREEGERPRLPSGGLESFSNPQPHRSSQPSQREFRAPVANRAVPHPEVRKASSGSTLPPSRITSPPASPQTASRPGAATIQRHRPSGVTVVRGPGRAATTVQEFTQPPVNFTPIRGQQSASPRHGPTRPPVQRLVSA